jgi:hypothetical protein
MYRLYRKSNVRNVRRLKSEAPFCKVPAGTGASLITDDGRVPAVEDATVGSTLKKAEE